ncbi:MAG: alpha/beta hydrolase [bacterium]|nr:alpha/beta hydrolase [bacterium]
MEPGDGVVENREGTVSVNGAELYYSTRGSGPTCLVLSAIGSEPYKRLTPPQLSERLRLVYVDLRGGGRSTGNPADLTFEVLADDLEAIRGELGVDQVAVLGHSILGVLAIEYGRHRPGSVSHVIVVGTPPSGGDMASLAAKSSAFFEEHASEDRKQLLHDNLANLPEGATMGATMLAQTPMRFYDARFDAAPLFAEADVKPGLLGHIVGTLTLGWTIRAESGSLRVPIFIAQGRHDYTVPYVLLDGVVDTLPNATLHVFEKSGHQPFFEEPVLFADTLSKWMADQCQEAVRE